MQCSSRARPEWAGRRLVALKRMKRLWPGGWDECRTLREIEVRSNYHFIKYPCVLLPPTPSPSACSLNIQTSFLYTTASPSLLPMIST